MANRIEIGENVESAIGLNLTGALVTVKFRGGAQAPVYDAANGGSLLTQPLATVNGKIGGDSPSGAWVAENDYDLLVTFGGDTLTYAYSASHTEQFVTALPAGAGTSAPEDGEKAIELYDAANGGAWLRRYRAAAAAWDMVGGPPPAGGALPGTPRARQEFYVTGGTPAIQHQRYNGATWDYVGTPPMVPITGSPKAVLDVGQANQIRAGHQLTVADFSTLLAAPTTPVGIFNLGDTSNLGSGGALTNKGTVTFGVGIEGVAASSAIFDGTTGKALYIVDVGAADPFRLKTFTLGAWIKTSKRNGQQEIMAKGSAGAGALAYILDFNTTNFPRIFLSTDGTNAVVDMAGTVDCCDDRWHHVVVTYDGAMCMMYIDGVLDVATIQVGSGQILATASPFNIGARNADGATVATAPFAGLIDEAFVTTDVLTFEQVRLLYAAKVAHGYSTTPRLAAVNVRRKRRGAPLAIGDFPSQPKRLHNFTAGALTDAGSDNQTLQNNNAATTIGGADGTPNSAFHYIVASLQNLSSTDTGLPAGTASRTYGAWFKTGGNNPTAAAVIAWGTNGTNHAAMYVINGNINSASGADNMVGSWVADGLWHFGVVVEDNAAFDGFKRKLYLDGRLVATSTTLTSITLAGANKFRVGAQADGLSSYFGGQIDEAFVFAGALTQAQIAVLYQKSTQALVASPREPGQYVEAMDATNLYAILDTIDTQNSVDVAVAA